MDATLVVGGIIHGKQISNADEQVCHRKNTNVGFQQAMTGFYEQIFL